MMHTPQTAQQTVDLLAASVGVAAPKLALDREPRLIDWADGLHANVPPELYHARELGVVSLSALKEFKITPAHYLMWVAGQRGAADKPAFALGRATHSAILEPESFARDFIVEPKFGDCRKKDNKARRDAWRAEHGYDEINETYPGKTVISEDDRMHILGMRDSVRRHPLASKMLEGGVSELTALWTDSMTGLRCKARADYHVASRALIVDVKTTDDASALGFRKSVFNYLYHWQHAIYRGAFAALGVPAKHFVFIAVEKTPPYAVATYQLDDRAIAVAHDNVRALMVTLADCLRKNEWPAYEAKIQTIQTPEWAA